jgi:hypothetical protein
MVACLSQ